MKSGSARLGLCACLFIVFLASCSSGGDDSPTTKSPNPNSIPAPSGISVTVGDQRLQIKWSQVAEAVAYELQLDTQQNISQTSANYQAFLDIQQNEILITGLQNNIPYFFTIRSVGANGGYSKYTPVSQATPKPMPPLKPLGFSAQYIAPTSVTLTWTNDPEASGYKLSRIALGSNTPWQVDLAAGSDTYNDTIQASTLYDYQLVASNAIGDSLPATLRYVPPPATPSGFSATPVTDTTVDLSWTEGDSISDHYELSRSENGGAYIVRNNNIVKSGAAATSITFRDSGLTGGYSYNYQVIAVNSAGSSPPLTAAYASPQKPTPPTGFTAQLTAGPQINLSWNAVDTLADKVVLSRAVAGSSSFVAIDTQTSKPFNNAFIDTSVQAGGSYDYRLQAVNNNVASQAALVNGVTIPNIPAAAGGLSIGEVTSTSVTLNWIDNSNNEDNFLVERAAASAVNVWGPFSTIATLAANSVSFSDTLNTANFPLNPGVNYKYRVVAVNLGGSSVSNEVATFTPPRDSNAFLAFSNKTAPRFQESAATAQAYYDAVDPKGLKTTFGAWKSQNGFGAGGAQDVPAIYVNDADLGFARKMYVNPAVAGSKAGIYNVASYVENYASLADALSNDPTKIIAIVAMEYTEPAMSAAVYDTRLESLADSYVMPDTINPTFVQVLPLLSAGDYDFIISQAQNTAGQTASYAFRLIGIDAAGVETVLLNQSNNNWTRRRLPSVGSYSSNPSGSDFSGDIYPVHIGAADGPSFRVELDSSIKASIIVRKRYNVIASVDGAATFPSSVTYSATLNPGEYEIVAGRQDAPTATENYTEKAFTLNLSGATFAKPYDGAVTLSNYLGYDQFGNTVAASTRYVGFRFVVSGSAPQAVTIGMTMTDPASKVVPRLLLLSATLAADPNAMVVERNYPVLLYDNYLDNVDQTRVGRSFTTTLAAGPYQLVPSSYSFDQTLTFNINDTLSGTLLDCTPTISGLNPSQGPNPFMAVNPRCQITATANQTLNATLIENPNSRSVEMSLLGSPGDYRSVVAVGSNEFNNIKPTTANIKTTLNRGDYSVLATTFVEGDIGNYNLLVNAAGVDIVNASGAWNPSAGPTVYSVKNQLHTFTISADNTPVDISLSTPGGMEPIVYLLQGSADFLDSSVLAQADGPAIFNTVVESDLLKGNYEIVVVNPTYNVGTVDFTLKLEVDGVLITNPAIAAVTDANVADLPYSPLAYRYPLNITKNSHVKVDIQASGEIKPYIIGMGERKFVTFYTYIGQKGVDLLTNNGTQAPPSPFYPANLAAGDRVLAANLDGRGDKYQPGVCNVCHGGAPKSLANGVYPEYGDTNAGFLAWDMDLFLYDKAPGSQYSRANLEPKIKEFNRTVLSVKRSATENSPAGSERQTARNELIYGWYGGAGLPGSFNGNFVPLGWRPDSQTGLNKGVPDGADQLYLQVIKPTCRLCHVQRETLTYRSGTKFGAPITFKSYVDFMRFKDDIEDLVYDRATMPLALRTFNHFWNRGQADILATLLGTQSQPFSRYNNDGSVMQPGRPIAATPFPADTATYQNADLHRYVATNSPVTLDASHSLFAANYQWTVLSQAAPVSLLNPNSATPSFTPTADGDYIFQLVVNDGANKSAPANITITAQAGYSAVSFMNEIMPVLNRLDGNYAYYDAAATLMEPLGDCMRCHAKRNEYTIFERPYTTTFEPQFAESTFLWSLSGTPLQVYNALLDRINFNEPLESRLLHPGSIAHHKNKALSNYGWGFDSEGDYNPVTYLPGPADWRHFNKVLRWIQDGAPYDGP